ncbi:MAG TPA: serine/threonine-protein kinase, partial [Candidatus Binatia bacterium]|nr:serine/threonine-protein kinase [Candidatus Binatia bacterium]
MKTIVNEATSCPSCGKPMPVGALAGLCPACLLAQGAETDAGAGPKGPKFEPPSPDAIAGLFPQLEILGFLGAGGMGAVYKARQPALDRLVALKILPASGVESAKFEERFNREARALARLSHPNIVAVHEFGKTGELHFFIMEFVDGANLRQLEQAGRLAPREVLQIIPQICDALQYAHDEGVVHRDIKPENVLLDRKGRVKIADFGLAKILGQDVKSLRLTAEGQVMGTPHYMAPEQLERPLTVDHRADIYSLGVVLYEMLTGDLPLGKFSPPSRKVQVDVRLDEVVLRALENDPECRYQKASEVKSQVESIAAAPATASLATPVGALNQQGSAAGAAILNPQTPWWRSRRAVMSSVLLLLVTWIIFREGSFLPGLRKDKVAPSTTNTPSVAAPQVEIGASKELWSPSLGPGEKPQPSKILDEAKEQRQHGEYEQALQRHIWYHNHALEFEPSLTGVRLSFALAEWIELGRRYPRARRALIEIRDEK